MTKTTKRKADYTPEEWEAKLDYARSWRAANQEKARKYSRDYVRAQREANPEKFRTRDSKIKRKRKGGFTDNTIYALLLIQGHRCAICRAVFKGEPHADHCHTTNAPRGLLCRRCNLIEGMIASVGIPAAEFGSRLQNYLEKPPARLIDWTKA